MSGMDSANEAVLQGLAKVLGLPSTSSLAELRPSGLWKLTQRELLDAARVLGLTKISRLNKEALLARIWESLERAGAVPAAAAAESALAAKAAPGSNGNGAEPHGPSKPAAVSKPAAAPPVAKAPPAKPVAPPAASAKPATPPIGSTDVTAGSPRPQVTPTRAEPESADSSIAARDSSPGLSHKFEVGEEVGKPVDLALLRAEAEAHIPWSYGRDRVTAMPVDPERLCVYWEVTGDGVAKARAGLGAAGAGAWLCLRVYDVTGRLFDGTNSHGYFDHNLDNETRQWFFVINRPTSQAIVEIGMKSTEGFFVKIARSSRVDFPRRTPVDAGDPEWMTVRASTGEVEGTHMGGHGGAAGGAHGGAEGWVGGGGGFGGGHDQAWQTAVGDVVAGLRRRLWEGRTLLDGGSHEERITWEELGGTELEPEVMHAWSWEGDGETTSWSAGPFSYPVEVPSFVRESYAGPARVYRVGPRTHVVWGPWQVVIRGVGAHAERQQVARWEIFRSWTTSGWKESSHASAVLPGSSDLRLGASERWGRSGSELRLGGASERYQLGASELRLGGASEMAFLGASQWVARGASERRLSGQSELRLGGASERRWGGASEWRFGGASEWRLGGASELRYIGGSEARLGGGSESRLTAPAEPGSTLATATEIPYSWPVLSGASAAGDEPIE